MINKKFTVFIVTAIMLLYSQVYSQNMGNITFINDLADKEEVTFEEAITFFVMVTENKTQSYESNLQLLQSRGILSGNISTDKNDPLKRGLLAGMIAEKLELGDSLLYMILPIERYAFRACVAEDIMQVEGSEWDTISGGELIEIMTAVSVILETGGV